MRLFVRDIGEGVNHAQALHEHGCILGCQFVPVELAGVCDAAAYLGVVA